MNNNAIGVFDSGVGGMTVLKELMKTLPNENFVYFGDTKRFPYGSKSKESIIELTKNGIEFLISKGMKLVCNCMWNGNKSSLRGSKRFI